MGYSRRQIPRVSIMVLSGAAMMLTAVSASANTFNVYVGHADSMLPSSFFPTPWLTSPNVVSQSAADQSAGFDAGAIRIDNTGADPITITDFKVLFPSTGWTFCATGVAGCTFYDWDASLMIPAGGTGIFTQTLGFNFDTSDFGEFGGLPPTNLEPNNADHNGNTNLIGGCSSPASFMTPTQLSTCNSTIPTISFVENGSLVSFDDTGHVLDTGEWDIVNNSAFGEDRNESINWNPVGSPADRGGVSIVPEPSSMVLLGTAFLLCPLLEISCYRRDSSKTQKRSR